MSREDWFCAPGCEKARLPQAAVESGQHECHQTQEACRAQATASLADVSTQGDAEASIDCFLPHKGNYMCVARSDTPLAQTALSWRGTPAASTESSGKGGMPAASTESSSLEHRVALLEKRQQGALLGLQAASDMEATGTEESERLWTSPDSGWGSPISAQVRYLGDGSALIARSQSTGAKLLTTTDLSGAERIALAARNAPVLSALDWLQRGDPLGFYDSEQPLNAWSVGGELARRYPSYVLESNDARGKASTEPSTVSEALFALEHALPRGGSPPRRTAHYCCGKESAGDCDLVSVERGTQGCTEIRSIDSLGAAKAHCARACGGASQTVSTCFDADTCELLSPEASRSRPCFADRLVCTTVRAQQDALRALGLTYA